jgi:hypothetical protein
MTSGGRLVGIVRLRTKATEFSLLVLDVLYWRLVYFCGDVFPSVMPCVHDDLVIPFAAIYCLQ